jgi:hypothetical protein
VIVKKLWHASAGLAPCGVNSPLDLGAPLRHMETIRTR